MGNMKEIQVQVLALGKNFGLHSLCSCVARDDTDTSAPDFELVLGERLEIEQAVSVSSLHH